MAECVARSLNSRESSRRFLSRQHSLHTAGHLLEIFGRTAFELRGHVASIVDLCERTSHIGPVDVSLPDILPGEPAARPIDMKVLQVHLDDSRAQCANPV